MSKKLRISIYFIISSIILLIIWNIRYSFMESKSLNYSRYATDISCINFWGIGFEGLGSKTIEVRDKEKIIEFLEFIDSIEVIEKDALRFFDNGRCVYCDIYSIDGKTIDLIGFSDKDLIIFDKGYDWAHTEYVIKSSPFKVKRKNVIYEYLIENGYVEE